MVPLNTPVPAPSDWARLHQLLSAARRGRGDIPEPPVPLILAGAAFSTASSICARWQEFIAWANEHGFANLLVANLPPAPEYDVAERIAGVSADGRGWWPNYGEQNHPRRPKPDPRAVATALRLLRDEWRKVAGPRLADCTHPVRFAGRKAGRLVVAADSTVEPPWGTWTSAARNPRAFTVFRRAVNDVISPMVVDDIVFIPTRRTRRDD